MKVRLEEGKKRFHLSIFSSNRGETRRAGSGAEGSRPAERSPVENPTINETLSDFFSPPPAPLLGLQLLDRVSPAHLARQMAQLTRERGERGRRWLKKKRGEEKREGEGGQIENRSAAWKAQRRRMSLLPPKPLPLQLFTRSREGAPARFHASSLSLFALRTHTSARTSRRRWIVRKSCPAPRAESGTDGRAARRLRPELCASPKLWLGGWDLLAFSGASRARLREADNPGPTLARLCELP